MQLDFQKREQNDSVVCLGVLLAFFPSLVSWLALAQVSDSCWLLLSIVEWF